MKQKRDSNYIHHCQTFVCEKHFSPIFFSLLLMIDKQTNKENSDFKLQKKGHDVQQLSTLPMDDWL